MRANIENRTIEMTKAEAKAAGKITSEKYKELKDYKEAYPGFEVVIVAASRKKSVFSDLTYEYMEAYIKKHDDEKKTKMAKFNELRGIVSKEDKEKYGEVSEKLEKAAYSTVKKWFLNTFTEIKDFHKNHKEKMEEILKAA